jgi:hypothetical protein
LEPIFEEIEPYTTGRPREKDLRDMVNAIFGSSTVLVEPNTGMYHLSTFNFLW